MDPYNRPNGANLWSLYPRPDTAVWGLEGCMALPYSWVDSGPYFFGPEDQLWENRNYHKATNFEFLLPQHSKWPTPSVISVTRPSTPSRRSPPAASFSTSGASSALSAMSP